jgi:translocator protein
MNRQCAWCNQHLVSSDGLAADNITHGICSPCYRNCHEELDESAVDANNPPQGNRTAADHSPGRSFIVLLFCLAACFATAGLGATFTSVTVNDWYQTLRKPTWTPPDAVFGPVWTALYFLMALAVWFYWRRAGWPAGKRGFGIFALQLGLNAAWSGLFFTLRSPGLAFAEILLLWGAIVVTIAVFRRASPLAAGLLVPYLGWVSFAVFLNAALWRLNP